MKTKNKIWIYATVALTTVLLFTISCHKSENDKTTLSVGQSYKGGKIAYILQKTDPGYDSKKQHGFIAAPCHYSLKTWWFTGTYVTVGTTSTNLGSGHANTIAIISAMGLGSYPAKLCADLEFGGYHDWFLPSKDELNKLYLNKEVLGDFSAENYWSSSEYNYGNVWIQNFSDGSTIYTDMGNIARFCPVRSF